MSQKAMVTVSLELFYSMKDIHRGNIATNHFNEHFPTQYYRVPFTGYINFKSVVNDTHKASVMVIRKENKPASKSFRKKKSQHQR